MSAESKEQDQHRRKRIRKGTRSCWECKRRKIKCIYQSETDQTCTGCRERGTQCISQEFEDVAVHQSSNSGGQLGARLGRVEQLLEQLMDKVGDKSSSSGTPEEDDMPDKLGIDVLTAHPSNPTTGYENNAPVLTLFDSALFGRNNDRAGCETPQSITVGSQASSPNVLPRRSSKQQKVKAKLVSLLPSQKAIDAILTGRDGWWFLKKHMLPQLDGNDEATYRAMFTLKYVLQPDNHVSTIGRLFACLTICLQQLPDSWDYKEYGLTMPARDLAAVFADAVQSQICSDDELIGTMDGLDCLAFHGFYHLNLGNLRRSWLSFRRALNVAQLMGLHRHVDKPPKNMADPFPERRGKYLWYQLVMSDRYVALLLGVPAATISSAKSVPYDAETQLGVSQHYTTKLCVLACQILERNEGDEDRAFSVTQDIDDRLEKLKKSMPVEWWEIPSMSEDKARNESQDGFDRLTAQIWHYQLEAFLHLPFMLRAVTERRYEYSKISCLRASRELIKRWQFFRTSKFVKFLCKIMDFQAFTSCLTVLLGTLTPKSGIEIGYQSASDESDRQLVRSVIHTLENMPGRDYLVEQSIEVLRTLEAVRLDSPCQPNSKMKLTIPHFGTIVLTSGPVCTPHLDGGSSSLLTPDSIDQPHQYGIKDGAFTPRVQGTSNNNYPTNPSSRQVFIPDPTFSGAANNTPQHNSINYNGQMQQPVFTGPVAVEGGPFVSFESSQFPMDVDLSTYGGNWDFSTAGAGQVMMFDSLLNTDVDGNWNF